MFNLGFGEILVICVVLIIVVGPERLPSVMKSVGKALRTMRQASRDVQSTIGLDELWTDDVLNPPPPRPPPPATVSRAALPETNPAPATPSAAETPPASGAAQPAPTSAQPAPN